MASIPGLRPRAGRPGSDRKTPGVSPAGRSGHRRRPGSGARAGGGRRGVPRHRRCGSPARPGRRWPWKGAEASVGVELGDHPGGGPVGEGSRRPCLWGGHQPVGVPVPTYGEEPLGGRGGLEPAQPRLEEVGRDGAVGERHLLGHGSEPAHRAGDDRTRATRWALRDWT